MSMDQVLMTAHCWACGNCFLCNPETVPVYEPSADDPSAAPGREPLCRSCVDLVNLERAKMGMPRIWVRDDMYAPTS